MALSEYTCVRKLCLAPRHSGRDAFSRAIIFLLRSVTKYYSLTLKITASVLHGLRKCVRELMVSDNRWLTLYRDGDTYDHSLQLLYLVALLFADLPSLSPFISGNDFYTCSTNISSLRRARANTCIYYVRTLAVCSFIPSCF